MTDTCKICLEGIEEQTLEGHVTRNHDDHGDSVKEMYPDVYEELFDDSGTLSVPAGEATAGTLESETTETGGSSTGDTSEGRDESSTTASGNDVAPTDEGTSLVGATGNKWLMVGIGGAGNHILDTVLMRRDALKDENNDLAQVWDGGLANYGNLNTNITELGQTYYAQEDRDYQREQLITNCMIGYRHHNYSGAGRNWRVGRELMKKDFEDETNAIRDRLDVNLNDVESSQAAMVIHSVTKGTGCGATPVFAENLRSLSTEGTGLDDSIALSKPILSSVVLPNDDEFGSSEMVRGVVGMSHLARSVDGIIPFDNSKLSDPPSELAVDIPDELLGRYNPPNYTDINRLLVTFLEAFTMSSTPQSADTSATERINGEVFDVPDSFRPVERKYPVDSDREYTPAVVMAPVIGKSNAATFDRARLDTLARSTLLQGQLIDFDPTTAWGGTFMIYGPQEKMDELSPHLNEGVLADILSGEDFLDRSGYDGTESIDVYVDQLVVPHVDSVYLWGLLWNPHLPTLENMYAHARELAEHSDSQEAAELRESWDDIEPLFECLGRENIG